MTGKQFASVTIRSSHSSGFSLPFQASVLPSLSRRQAVFGFLPSSRSAPSSIQLSSGIRRVRALASSGSTSSSPARRRSVESKSRIGRFAIRQAPRSRLEVIGAQNAGLRGGRRVACMGCLNCITIPEAIHGNSQDDETPTAFVVTAKNRMRGSDFSSNVACIEWMSAQRAPMNPPRRGMRHHAARWVTTSLQSEKPVSPPTARPCIA